MLAPIFSTNPPNEPLAPSSFPAPAAEGLNTGDRRTDPLKSFSLKRIYISISRVFLPLYLSCLSSRNIKLPKKL
ncbi:hypothetical protein Hanom_Chr16g01458841 [Helianthus anomalus]